MDRSWIHSRLFSPEHIDGVKQFMSFVQEKFSENVEILCPCGRCLNQKYLCQALVNKHILMHGMDSSYTRWIHHGESFDADVIEHHVVVHDNDDSSIHGGGVREDDGPDHLEEMLEDLQAAAEQERLKRQDAENQDGDGDAEPHDKDTFLKVVMKEAKRQLYPGCTKFSRFSFVVMLLHMKSLYRISNSAFSAILKVLAEAFPDCNTLPKSYTEAKNLLKELGLGYDSIHVCFNNCVLFRKDYAKHDNCPVCGLSRWKDPQRKKIPQKVLRHFPLAPRLKRMFATKEASKDAQWHKFNQQPGSKEMSHPADGEAWQHFDKEFPDFAMDARNLRLGLATDGFNPFSEKNTKYSMWPVFVVPYNLPPWACMQESNFMMTLLIPGPSSPGKDFDVFLEPLVEDLLNLWTGVSAYDANTGKMFKLHAAVLWCIHDYPALSTLSGRTTKGYYACTHCDKYPLSYRLRSKIGYFGHYRFLPKGHRLRRNNEYVGLHQSNDPPGQFSIEELLAELEKVKDVRPGKQKPEEGSGKRKRSNLGVGHVKIWNRMVSLWIAGPSLIPRPQLCPYEQQRLAQCMTNSKRLAELGIAWSQFNAANALEKNKRPHRNSEDSGSEYDPALDDTDGGDLMDVDSAKTFKKGSKKANTETSDVPAIKFRGRKRVFAQPPTVSTRSKQSKPQSNASLTTSDLRAAIEGADISSHDKNTNMATGAGISLHDENTNMTTGTDICLHDENNMTTGGDAIAQPDGHNNMANEDGFVQQDDHTTMAEGADGITHPGGNHAMANQEEEVEWNRGPNMGHGLQRLNRARRGKLRVIITAGHQRPLVPLVAAKFATECNIIVRNHIPVFTHWKEYKRDSQWFTSFCKYLQAKFEIDTEDPIVKKACLNMMKDAVRNQRHRLKKDHFDPFPVHLVSSTSPVKSMTDKQWRALVESWKNPKKIHECEMNKGNRSKLQFPQSTGSQSYEVYIQNKVVDKYKDVESSALDLFKECHFSTKKGFKPAVQSAIIEMENRLSALTGSEGTDGSEQHKVVKEVVHGVLSEKTKKNKFLQNVGIQIVQPASIEQNSQADLAAENAELRTIINTQHSQLEELSKEVQETKEARSRDKEEMKKMQDVIMKKMQTEMDAKLELVLSQVRLR